MHGSWWDVPQSCDLIFINLIDTTKKTKQKTKKIESGLKWHNFSCVLLTLALFCFIIAVCNCSLKQKLHMFSRWRKKPRTNEISFAYYATLVHKVINVTLVFF